MVTSLSGFQRKNMAGKRKGIIANPQPSFSHWCEQIVTPVHGMVCNACYHTLDSVVKPFGEAWIRPAHRVGRE